MVVFTAIGAGIIAAAAGYGLVITTSAFVVGLVTTVVLGAALRALTPKMSIGGGSNRGYQTTAIGSALDHQIIYGKMRVGGARIYDEATGTNNKYLHRIIAVAGHEIQSFDEIYVNDELITLDVNGDVTSPAKYNGKIRIKLHLGASNQAADTFLVAESIHWTTQHTLSGIAYMYIRLAFDADAFPNGIPTITSTISGKKVYDPRTSTTVWSDNPALCLRDYLISPYGIAEETANIDDTLVIAAANVSDQLVGSLAIKTYAGGVYKIKTVGTTDFTLVGAANNNVGTVFTATGVAVGTGVVETARYTCNGAFTTASTPYDMINSLLTSMDGSLWYAQGSWRMKPAYWTAPVLDLNEDDLRSSISVSTRHSRRNNFNTVKGTFRGLESNWQTTDYPQFPENTTANPNPFLTVDGGQESVADIDLPFTDNSVEARRIARISLERNRQQLTVNASFGLKTLQVQVGDNIRLTNSRFGWSNKEFEVIAWSFGLTDGLDLQTQMTLRETAESVYDEVDDNVVYEKDNTALLSPFLVPTPGITPTVVARVFAEKLVNELTLDITSGASESIDHVEVQYKDFAETDYKAVGSGELGKFTIIDLEKSFYDARARAINTFGVKGDWKYEDNIEVDALSDPPANITNFVFELASGSLFLQWDAVPDLDLSYYQVKHSPLTTGAIWATGSSVVLSKVARPATNASLPARSGTFLIKAFDKNLNESVSATSVVVLPSDLPSLGTSVTLTENPVFDGPKTNCIVVSNQLEIDNTSASTPTATYLMQNQADYIDTDPTGGSSRTVRATGSVVFERIYDNGTLLWDAIPQNFDTWPDLFDGWTNENAGFGDVSVTVFIRATPDDPASSPTWGSWTLANGSDVVGRAFEFKAELKSDHTNFSPSIVTLTGKVEY